MEWIGLASLSEWDRLSEQIIIILRGRGFNEKEIISFIVALEEIYVNISSYAYAPKKGVVRTRLDIYGNTVSVTFCDSGKPFDPLKAAVPDMSGTGRERTSGGLGIFIARLKTDDMTYEYTGGENRLTLIKIFNKGD